VVVCGGAKEKLQRSLPSSGGLCDSGPGETAFGGADEW
jgi:hypothetical protein